MKGAGIRREAEMLVRQALAGCYFHSPLPRLGRRLRDRYSMSISSRGALPRIAWNRRSGSGRILCFHRINNDNDPFFPAISTHLFEPVMQFIAQYHKVVSLAELMDRLRAGSPEAVLAITFDDGYQDNYHNAFPILQRYGLPATIFLTTGAIDSGEPLWFEQLAQTLKTTSREFIEVETDVRRGFWLRTHAERLESNRRIFGLLRNLPDAARRECLARILRQASAGSEARKNEMLTWDQVRSMKSRGIDFGGHTVTHPFLSKTTPQEMEWEVSECKRRIEAELQQPVKHFAYPNGRQEDIAEWSKEVLRRSGFEAAVTTIWGLNDNSTDPLELRRSGPWETSSALFAYKLDWYQLTNG